MRLVAILGITAGVTIALVLMASGMGRADKALLYTELSLKEAGEISARLEQMNVKYELRSGGTAIFVDRDKIQSAKMTLAADNLPSSASIGYDIFDQANSMGQTTFTQNINKLRALQGELERTITTLDGVEAARVLLVLPERQLFQTKTEKAKASVTIKLGTNSIGHRQTTAIQHLVASAVPGLTTRSVTIIDDTGRVLSDGNDDAEGNATSGRRADIEDALRNKIRHVLTSITGQAGVEVQVNVELDRDRITEKSTVFDPDGQVVISSSTSEQNSDDKDQAQNGAVTVGGNVPGASNASATDPGSSSITSATTETINYGVSKTETTRVFHSGMIKRLSIAVNVDGVAGVDADGNPTWAPRTTEEMVQIENLVKSAVGFDLARKDQVQVTNLRFSKPTPLEVDENGDKPGFNKNDIMRMIELGILAIVSIVMVLFLGRPLITALFSGGGSLVGGPGALAIAGAGSAVATGVGNSGAMPQLPGASGANPGQAALPAPDALGGFEDPGLDVSRIEGQVKASSVKKVAGIVESHPEESMSILRTWLHEA